MIKVSKEGRRNLHVWRANTVYETQKRFFGLEDWTGIRFDPLPQPKTKAFLTLHHLKKLPFPRQTFDAVYINRILEHLSPEEGSTLVSEVYKALRPGGYVRLVVPDLERLCRAYLNDLQGYIEKPTDETHSRYQWSASDLVDQMIRAKSGGRQFELYQSKKLSNDFFKERTGDVFRHFSTPSEGRTLPSRRLFDRGLLNQLQRLKRRVKLIQIHGDPRKTGENHRWMYDKVSLKLLLTKCGFTEIQRKAYSESNIPNWDRYMFDQSDHGDYPLEPSLYMECRK